MSTRLLDGSPSIAMRNRMEDDRMSAKERLYYDNVRPFAAYAAPVVPAAAAAAAPAPADPTPEQRLQVCNDALAAARADLAAARAALEAE